jgi:hypothetical protein
MIPLLLVPLAASNSVASITVNATSIRSGDAVRVTWAGVGDLHNVKPMHVKWYSESIGDSGEHKHRWRVEPKDASSLWVGQFSPPVADVSSIHMGGNPMARNISTEGSPPFTVPAPVKFISGTQLARGYHDFIVSNMRSEVNWVLFSGSLTNASDFAVLAVSPSLKLSDASAPMHVRLSRTSSTDQMRVAWTSAQGGGGAVQHAVQWGIDPAKLDKVVPAATHTYQSSDLCGFPANESGFHAPGYFHEAVVELAGVAPAARPTRVYYRVGSDGFGWSSTRSFAPPQPVGPHTPLSVIITADMGET